MGRRMRPERRTWRGGHRQPCRRCRRSPQPGEDGFTLIELLIVLVILPLVVGAVAIVLITTLEDDQGVQGTVADSSAATLASSYYVRDVESAGSVTTDAGATAPAPCSAAGLSGTTAFLLGLQLQGTTPTATVSYYTWTPAPGAVPELVREYCGASQSHDVLSDNLSSTNLPQPSVSCISPTPTSIPTGVTCAPSTGWTPTYMVSNVTLNVTQACVTSNSACTSYQYALNGDPQSGVPIPPINQPCAVVTLLSPQNDISMGGSFTLFASEALSAQGPIALNSGYNTGGNNNAAIAATSAFLSSVTVNATATSSCANVPSADAIGVYNCQNTSSSGASTNFVACPTSGQHTTLNGVTPSPNPPVQISTGAAQNGIPDPLLAWASQQTIPSSLPSVTCPPSTNMNCPAGSYASGLTIPNNATVTFQPGNYQFGGSVNCLGTPTSLCIQNNDTVNFGTGHYTYLNGIDVAGSGSALCGGMSASSACPHPPVGGVNFYVKSGITNFGNFVSSTSVQLSATAGNPVLLWPGQWRQRPGGAEQPQHQRHQLVGG